MSRQHIAAAQTVVTTTEEIRIIDHAKICMSDSFSQVMHNYEANRSLDPCYVNSVIISLKSDYDQVARNLRSKLLPLWEIYNSTAGLFQSV